jgi:hypothetical protein
MKTFRLVVPKDAGSVFDANVRALLAYNVGLERIILPLLEAWRSMRDGAVELDRQLDTSGNWREFPFRDSLFAVICGDGDRCRVNGVSGSSRIA